MGMHNLKTNRRSVIVDQKLMMQSYSATQNSRIQAILKGKLLAKNPPAPKIEWGDSYPYENR